MDEASRNLNRWFPKSFKLIPKNSAFSAEHVAYAYHSVAQRFVFIFSQHSLPLSLFSIALSSLPAAVAFWNLTTDVRDAYHFLLDKDPAALSVIVRVLIGLLLFICIVIVTLRSARLESNTSTLLNAWYLASRDVWMKEWDENTDDCASTVEINVEAQTANRALK
jgi:hypothetical protein